jgi:osmotically-inducible protein OsmY
MTKYWLGSASRTLAVVAASTFLGIAALAHQAKADTTMPDAWITTKAKLALLTTEGVSATSVNVDTIDGRVTLHGIVASASEKGKAEDAVRGIKGTREVRNLLQIVKDSAHPATKVADAELKDRVSAALGKDSALANSKIAVASVNKGVVLLGHRTDPERHAARGRGRRSCRRRSARGERDPEPDVIGDAEVWREGKYDATAAAGSTAQDMWTTSAVKMRLLASSKTPGFDINVDTDGGVVTLFGVVDSQAAKDAAGAEVGKVDGVKSIVNELQIVAPGKQDMGAANDESIDDAVNKRLDANERLKGSAIEIDVKNGVVHLTGTVDSQSDRITALTVTRSTLGVRGLVDDLKVVASVSEK